MTSFKEYMNTPLHQTHSEMDRLKKRLERLTLDLLDDIFDGDELEESIDALLQLAGSKWTYKSYSDASA